MLLLQGATAAPWPAAAVHDSVAAIAAQSAYERTLAQSLLRRLFSWIGDLFGNAVDALRDSNTGRTVVTTLVVVLVALVIVRIVIAARATRDGAAQATARARRLAGADPWGDAERLAAVGQFTEAAHALFAALLSAIAARGDVRLHASKTAGDYARELRRRGSPAHGGFQSFRGRYDRVVYGVGTCSADEYAALLRDARPLLALASPA